MSLYCLTLTEALRAANRIQRPGILELTKVSYNNVNMLDAIPSKPTMANYVVIGGSGYLGTYALKRPPKYIAYSVESL